MRAMQREGQALVSTGAGGAVPNSARPAALEVRNNSKDVSPADGGWEGLYMSSNVLMFIYANDCRANQVWP
jgi:hypothetical protein